MKNRKRLGGLLVKAAIFGGLAGCLLTWVLVFLVAPYPYAITVRAQGVVLTGGTSATDGNYNIDRNDLAAAMQPANIDDDSPDVATMRLETDPGEVGTESLPTNWQGENRRLRFAIRELKGTTYWYETAANTLAGVSGLQRNLLVNAGEFTRLSATVTDPPDGWSLVVTPSNITINASDASEAGTNKVQITSDAANEGISQALDDTVLKASTIYTIWGRYKVDGAGMSAAVTTTGATTNCSQTALTATTFTTVTCTFTTDATPTTVNVRLLAEEATDVVHFDNFVVVEGNVNPQRFVANPQGDPLRVIIPAPPTPLVRTLYEDSITKAWVKWTYAAGAPGIDDDLNISSLSDDGVGVITANFATAMASANYAAAGNAVFTGGTRNDILMLGTLGTTNIGIQLGEATTPAAQDTDGAIMIVGNN